MYSRDKFAKAMDPSGLEDLTLGQEYFARIVIGSVFTNKVLRELKDGIGARTRYIYQVILRSNGPNFFAPTPENLFLALNNTAEGHATSPRYIEVLDIRSGSYLEIDDEAWTASRQFSIRTKLLSNKEDRLRSFTVLYFKDLGDFGFEPEAPPRQPNRCEEAGHFIFGMPLRIWNGARLKESRARLLAGTEILFAFGDNGRPLIKDYCLQSLRDHRDDPKRCSPIYPGYIQFIFHLKGLSPNMKEFDFMVDPLQSRIRSKKFNPETRYVLFHAVRTGPPELLDSLPANLRLM